MLADYLYIGTVILQPSEEECHMKRLVFSCLALSFLIVSRAPSQGTMLMSPFLQAVATDGVSILVESSSADTVIVDYGASLAYIDSARTLSIETTTASTFIHNVRLSGLSPNTIYHYRARQGFGTSSDVTFQTAVEAGSPFRFAWMADFRTNTQPHDAIAAQVAAAHPVVSLYGGDLATTGGYADLKSQFFRPKELS